MKWIRLYIVVEGQTEEAFVRNVLAEHLVQYQVLAIPKLIQTGTNNSRMSKGGFLDYGHLRRDLERWLKQDRNPDARFTTMIDLYKYPRNAPGYSPKRPSDPYTLVAKLEADFLADIGSARFMPYIQLHEYETILYSDISKWYALLPGSTKGIQALEKSVRTVQNVELINDGEATAPSKRILKEIPCYDKVVFGALLASEVGLPRIRACCRHFNEWVDSLEKLIGD